MVDALLLQKKISQLSEYYSDLVEMRVISLADFVTDKKSRRYVERTLHLAVEVA